MHQTRLPEPTEAAGRHHDGEPHAAELSLPLDGEEQPEHDDAKGADGRGPRLLDPEQKGEEEQPDGSGGATHGVETHLMGLIEIEGADRNRYI